MDEATTTEAPDAPEGQAASEAPLLLVVALWVPVVAVVAWFLVRLSAGRWITDPTPKLGARDPDDADPDDPSP